MKNLTGEIVFIVGKLSNVSDSEFQILLMDWKKIGMRQIKIMRKYSSEFDVG